MAMPLHRHTTPGAYELLYGSNSWRCIEPDPIHAAMECVSSWNWALKLLRPESVRDVRVNSQVGGVREG